MKRFARLPNSLLYLALPLGLACVANTEGAPKSERQPKKVENAKKAPPAPLTVSRSACAKARCSLTFTFSRPMVPANRLATAKPIGIQFEPAQSGTWRWTAPTRLRFTPKAGAMDWGHEINMSLQSAKPLRGPGLANPWKSYLRVRYFRVAGKVADWPVLRGEPKAVAVLDRWYNEQIGRGPIFIGYDQPVNPKTIAKHIRASFRNTPLRVSVWRPKTVSRVWSNATDTKSIVAVRVTGLPDNGKIVELTYPTHVRGKATKTQQISYTVRKTLGVNEITLARVLRNGRAPVRARWYIEFDGNINPSQLRKAISIVPRPAGTQIHSYGSRAVIRATLKPGAHYRIRVAPLLRDDLGNRLTTPVTRRFIAQDLEPALGLPSSPVVLEASRPILPLHATNVADIQIRTKPLTDIKAFSQGPNNTTHCKGGHTDQAFRHSARINQRKQVTIPLPKTAGLYCVAVSAKGRGSQSTKHVVTRRLVQITPYGITAKVHRGGVLAWVTRLRDTTSVANATVSLLNKHGHVVSTATTQADGVAVLSGGDVTSRATIAPSFVVAEVNGVQTITKLNDKRVAQPWQFGIEGDVSGTEKLTAAIFTDRGVYRPKETVRLKAILRKHTTNGSLGLPNDTSLNVEVTDPRGHAMVNETLTLDPYGATNLDIPLKEDAKVGTYRIKISQGDAIRVHGFQVEEYRVPTFEVTVQSKQSAWPLNGATSILVTAKYLHGGRLAGRKVGYSIRREPIALTPKQFSQFRFALPNHSAPEAQLQDNETRLNGQGELAISFTPRHPAAAGPMRYIVDAHVTDVDRQVYAGRLTRTVHPTDLYVGVQQPTRTVIAKGETIEVPVLAIAPDGRIKRNVRITVTANAIEHHTTTRATDKGTERRNRPVAKRAARCSVRTSHKPTSCKLRLRKAGHYQIIATAYDSKRRKVSAGVALTVGGAEQIPWPRFDHERIQILADKASYHPGDTAQLAIQSPFAVANGLLTLERDGVIEHRWFRIRKNAPIVKVPISANHAPNIFASVVLLRGRVHNKKDATGFETGAPGFRLGYVKLDVVPNTAKLDVAVKPDHNVTAPGKTIGIDVTIRDHEGKPAAGQATIMVVDEAVLGLTRFRTPNPLAALYSQRPLGVRTGSSRLDLLHSRRARREALFPGGDGDDWNEDGSPDEEENESAGINGRLRSLFESTAYWNPNVQIGENGTTRIEVKLPDNVTTFRIMTIVADKQGRAGSGQSKLVVRKPVLVKAVVPRFIYPDDRIGLQAQVFNGTNEPMNAQINASFKGLKLHTHRANSKKIAAGGSALFNFPVDVTGATSARVQFAVTAGSHSDGVEVTIPILDPGTRRKLIETKTIARSDKIELKLPKTRIPETTSIEITASSTSLSKLRGAVDYVMGYPNGCIEQTTSTTYPLVVLEDLLPDIGVTVDDVAVKKFATAGVKRLLSFQTSAGGLSYWPGSNTPHAFGTAFGLTALIEAKQRGYNVPPEALRNMGDYLIRTLKSGAVSREMPHGHIPDGDTRALFVMTLGRLNRPQHAYISSLWQNRDKLTGFGLSFLAVAVKEGSGDRSLLQPILDEIQKRATVQDTEAYFGGQRDKGWSMGSPLRTHGAALLAFASAKPAGTMSPKLLGGLLNRQQRGLWGNTQENVFGIMAVTQAVKKPSGGHAPKMTLQLNGASILGELRPVSKRTLRYTAKLHDKAGAKLQITNQNNTPIIVTFRAQYDEALTPSTMKPVANGFLVSRSYETKSGISLKAKPIPLGSLVVVRINVRTNKKYNYVALADRLPAGLEPLNTSLKTTQNITGRKLTKPEVRGLGVLSYSETRDSRVAFYADSLPSGTYEFTYLARATMAGTFRRPAALADAMYDPKASGTSAIDTVQVK